MRNKKDYPKWCPYGRLSIQRFEEGKFREAVPVSFNLTEHVDLQNGIVGQRRISTYCIKDNCALYKEGIFPWSKGDCSLKHSHSGPWIVAAFIIVEIIAIIANVVIQKV